MSAKVKGLNTNWKNIIYDFVYVFHRNIGHIMHRFWDISPNRARRSKLDLSDLTNYLKSDSIPFIFYYRIGFTPKKLHCAIILIILGKWAKPDLSDLENDLLNNSINSISCQLINIIPKKLYTKNKEKLSARFWSIKKYQNTKIWPFSDLSDLGRIPLEWFNQIHLLAVHQYPPCEATLNKIHTFTMHWYHPKEAAC